LRRADSHTERQSGPFDIPIIRADSFILSSSHTKRTTSPLLKRKHPSSKNLSDLLTSEPIPKRPSIQPPLQPSRVVLAHKSSNSASSIISPQPAFKVSDTVKAVIIDSQKKRPQSTILEKQFLGYSSTHLYGLFDGIGIQGSDIASLACAVFLTRFKKIMTPALQQRLTRDFIVQALESSFDEAATSVLTAGFECEINGCTALICFIHDQFLYSVNLGDVKLVVGEKHIQGFVSQHLSFDHTMNNSKEAYRIQTGKVQSNNQSSISVERQQTEQQKAPLALTRAIGCTASQHFGLIRVPEIRAFHLSSYDKYLIIGSQAIFSNFSAETILSFLYEQGTKAVSLEKSTDKLITALRDKNKVKEQVEEMTLIVVKIEICSAGSK